MNKVKLIKIIATIVVVSICATCVYSAHMAAEELQVANNTVEYIRTQLDDTQTQLGDTKKSLKAATDKRNELGISLDNMSKELKIANKTIEDLKNTEYELVYMGDFKITHYCTESYGHICGSGSGKTATGTTVTVGRTIAVDPKVIPYGTKVYIEGYGWHIAEDCGGSVNGNHIDVAVETHDQAMSMGLKHGGVWVLLEKSS